jgi:hypothetical protein
MIKCAMTGHKASLHRACRLFNLSRSVYHYEHVLADDTVIKDVLNKLVEQYRY